MPDLEGKKSKFHLFFPVFHVHECPLMPSCYQCVGLKEKRENNNVKNYTFTVSKQLLSIESDVWKGLLDYCGCFRIFSGCFSHSKKIFCFVFFFFFQKKPVCEKGLLSFSNVNFDILL